MRQRDTKELTQKESSGAKFRVIRQMRGMKTKIVVILLSLLRFVFKRAIH
jgi:hypothetical protein